MKKKITIFIFFSFMSATMGMLGDGEEWCIDGPGGKYGVISIHTEWSYVHLGPIQFETRHGFETTRLIYFEIIPICIIAILILGVYRSVGKRNEIKQQRKLTLR
ncbi:MAG: hypothetical protein JXR78_17820 [Victivallales bacterium]|nr:hypothetical protein [Victivallales bacterium]